MVCWCAFEYCCFAEKNVSVCAGDIVYLNVLGQSILLLGSQQATSDLMDKRSANNSCRLHLPMLVDLSVIRSLFRWSIYRVSLNRMAFDWVFPTMPYGENWRRHRKKFSNYFGTHAAEAFKPVHEDQSRQLLQNLKSTPDDFLQHLRQYVESHPLSS